MVFLLDTSGNVRIGSWRPHLTFAINVTRALDISPDRSRVACVTFSYDATVQWPLEGENPVYIYFVHHKYTRQLLSSSEH